MSEQLRNYEEKRDFMRMDINSEAVLRIHGESYPATCIDLSSTGVRLQVSSPAAVGDEVEVEIISSHSSLSSFRASATVVRCEAASADAQVLGLQVKQIL